MHMYELNIVHRYKEAFVTLAFQTLADGSASQRYAPHVAPLLTSAATNTSILNKPRNSTPIITKTRYKGFKHVRLVTTTVERKNYKTEPWFKRHERSMVEARWFSK